MTELQLAPKQTMISQLIDAQLSHPKLAMTNKPSISTDSVTSSSTLVSQQKAGKDKHSVYGTLQKKLGTYCLFSSSQSKSHEEKEKQMPRSDTNSASKMRPTGLKDYDVAFGGISSSGLGLGGTTRSRKSTKER